jgi:ribosomal protein S6
MSETNTRLYELGFILVPTTVESEVSSKVNALKALITKSEGVVTTEGIPEYIDLAYTMEKVVGSKRSKYSQGYFGFIKFETSPESLEGLKKALDMEEDLVRYILLKTNPENTIVFKKPKLEAKRDMGLVDEDIVDDSTLDVEDEVSAHEALPDLLPDLEIPEEIEEKETE